MKVFDSADIALRSSAKTYFIIEDGTISSEKMRQDNVTPFQKDSLIRCAPRKHVYEPVGKCLNKKKLQSHRTCHVVTESKRHCCLHKHTDKDDIKHP